MGQSFKFHKSRRPLFFYLFTFLPLNALFTFKRHFYLFTFLPFYLYQPLAAVFLVLLALAGTLLLVN